MKDKLNQQVALDHEAEAMFEKLNKGHKSPPTNSHSTTKASAPKESLPIPLRNIPNAPTATVFVLPNRHGRGEATPSRSPITD